MGSRELRDKYGGKTREAIRRAIRAECPGGNLALDHLEAWYRICNRIGWRNHDDSGREQYHVTAYRHVQEIADAMEDSICNAYGIPNEPKERPEL